MTTRMFLTEKLTKEQVQEGTTTLRYRCPDTTAIVGIECGYEDFKPYRFRFGPMAVLDSTEGPNVIAVKPLSVGLITKWLRRFPIPWKPSQELSIDFKLEWPLLHPHIEITIVAVGLAAHQFERPRRRRSPLELLFGYMDWTDDDDGPDVDGIF